MRIPKGNIMRFLAACALTIWLAACSDGGGNVTGGGGGIIGTGKQVVASGEVNGFGSATVTGSGGVIVNGIEFTRSTAPDVSPAPITFAFDNISTAHEDRLRPGMLVTVSGTYDSDSKKGSYTAIVFSPELRGPLDSGSVNAVAGTGSCSVLGRTVQSNAATVFDGISDMNELALRQSQRPELEISGYLDIQGRIQASRIALKSSGFVSGAVQFKGPVGALGEGFFNIGGVSVATDSATFVDMSAADLALPGLVIEVRGTLSGATITNAHVERKSSTEGVAIGDKIRIKGVAAGPLSGDSFVIAGPDGTLRVKTSGATFQRGENRADGSIVVAGTRLEVEGTVQPDGSMAAREVESESQRSVRLEGDLTSLDLTFGTLLLNGVSVTVGTEVAIRDNRKTPPPTADLTLAGLAAGDHLRVDGFLDGNGRVVASQLQRFDATSTTILQGPVTSVDSAGKRLVILGVTVSISPAVEMVKGISPFADFNSFAAQVATGSTVVKAKGMSSDGTFTAASLEIET